MGNRFNVIVCALGISALAGCANFNAVKKDFVLKDGASVSIDAKQRAIYSVRSTDSSDSGNPVTRDVVCAEPSPDALSALAANLGVDLTVAAKSLGLAYGTQEGAASIGLRTQTIQTLRDAMYRLCEGYAGGALDDVGFVRLQRRYQAVMLGLLAIEQLTGATVANQATIGGNGAAKVGNSFGQVSTLITDTRQKQIVAQATATQKADAVAAKKKDVAAAEAALKKATEEAAGQETPALKAAKEAQSARGGELAAAEGELAKAKQDVALATADLDSLEQLRKEMDRASAVTSASAQLSGATHAAQGTTDAEATKRVAQAVENIVTTIVNHDYSKEACMDWLLSRSMRDSYLKGGGGDRRETLAKVQVDMCLQERAMTQELALDKQRLDAEVAIASARIAAAARAPAAPSPTSTAKAADKPVQAFKGGKPTPKGKDSAKPLSPVPNEAQAGGAPAPAPAAPATRLLPPKSAFDPASASERINAIIDKGRSESAKPSGKTPEK